MVASDVLRARVALRYAGLVAPVNPTRALDVLTRAITPSLRRSDPELTAQASYLRARLLSDRGEYGAALGSVQSARRDWLAAGRPIEAYRTDLGKATVLHELGNYRGAITVSSALLEHVTTLDHDPGDHDAVSSLTARAHNNLGNAWGRLGEHQRALGHYDVAANLFHALGDSTMQARADANRGLAYLKLGMAHRALDELNRAERALAAHGRVLAAAKCRMDIADAQLHLDDVEAAIKTLAGLPEVLATLEAAPELGRLHLTLGNAMLRARLGVQARREARAAVDVFGELSMMDESGRAAYLCAMVSMMLGEDDVALVELEEAARLFVDCGDAGYEARVMVAQAQLAERRGDLAGARRLAEAGMDRLEGMREMVPATIARLLLARLCEGADADTHLAAAADQITTLGLLALTPSLELARVRHERRTGAAASALARLRTAARRPAQPALRVLGDVELRLALQGAAEETIDELVALLLEQGTRPSITEAWQWSAASRGRTLNDFVARAVQADSMPHGPLIDGSEDEPGDARGRREASSRGNRRTGVPPIELPTAPEGPILHFHVLGEDVVAFVARDGGVEARRLVGAGRRSAELVAEWIAECTRMSSAARDHVAPASEDRDRQRLRLVLADLHQILIEPVEDLLQDGYGLPLLVLPHRHLFSVPFEALQGRGEAFSARYRLAFAPGIVELDADPPALGAGAGAAVVLGVPDDKAPKIELEVDRVAELLPTARVLRGEEATGAAFLAAAPAGSLIHLACHGTYCADSPFYSALRLADREVSAAEIVALEIPGSLVVLSACAAGQSSDVASEPAGLGWAFLAAGAGAVVASLWSVEDAVAVDFMTELYAHLAGGLPVRDALGAARTELARRWPHPYHWASFRFTCSPAYALTEGLTP